MSDQKQAGTRRVRCLIGRGAIALGVIAAVLAPMSSKGPRAASALPTGSTSSKGPAAELSPMTGGNGVYLGEATKPNLRRAGYVQREYTAAGTATSYTASSSLAQDGRWTFASDTTAPYRTRVVVRAPAQASAFSGAVMLEWLNVSGGVDADPEWVSTSEEIVRSGDVWVGVSAQRIGVEGGPVITKVENVPGAEDQGKGLKKVDPARYGTLEHPGDGYAFDIFTQVAQAIRSGAGMNGLKPKRLIAGGESQSAFALVSYYNGVQPLAKVFDGFFVHSRGAIGLPLVAAGGYADIAGAIRGIPTIFRTDQPAPVMDIQTETDVASILNSYAARQPDSKRFRLWEVAGTAHADAHLVGPYANLMNCGVPINDGPMHIVAKAAYHDLKTWLTNGTAPPVAPRIDVTPGTTPQVVRDDDGIARGGIRTPPVDVPVAALSGAPGENPSTICLLLGSATPLSAARLAALYPSRKAYLARFTAAADKTIKAGFALRADRAALLGFAEPSQVG
jgi:Alpha/beta hydrolase domain